MQTTILITDGGPHSPKKWAECTAEKIVQIGDHVVGKRLEDALRLQVKVMDILEGHHTTIQEGERTKLADAGIARLAEPIDAEHHLSVDEVIEEIKGVFSETPYEGHFKLPETVAYLRDLLSQHFSTAIDIERQWHQAGAN